MPNVAKVKDGNVGKNNKGDGKVVVVGKRSRKMRGGGETFKQYCEKFVLDHKGKFDEAKSFVKDMFNNLYYAIDKIDIKGKWGSSIFVTNAEKVNRRDALQIIFKILKKTDDENDKQKGKDDEEELDSITTSKKEKTNVKGILGIDGINNTELISLLNYINLNMKNIITSYTKIKTTDIKKINKLEQFNKEIHFDENQLKTLFKYLLFLKIYKLFSEFADISVVEIISNIQIENAGDKGEEHTNMLKGIPEIPTRTLELGWSNNVYTGSLQQTDQTAADPQQERNTFLRLTTDAVNEGINRFETNRSSSSIYVPKSKPVSHLPAKVSDNTENKGFLTTIAVEEQKVALTEPIIYDKETTIQEFEKFEKLLSDTYEYKQIFQYYKFILREANTDENVVRKIIADILWKTYNDAIDYFKGNDNIEKIRGFISYLNIENIERIHNSYIVSINSLLMTDDVKKKEMIKYVNDAKTLSLIYNEMLKVILKNHLKFLQQQQTPSSHPEQNDELSISDDDGMDDGVERNALLRIFEDIYEQEVNDYINGQYKLYTENGNKIITDYMNEQLFTKYKEAKKLITRGLHELEIDSRIDEISNFISTITEENVDEAKTQIMKKINSEAMDDKKLAIEFINYVYTRIKKLNQIYTTTLEKYKEELTNSKQSVNDPLLSILNTLTINDISNNEKNIIANLLKYKYTETILAIETELKKFNSEFFLNQEYMKKVKPLFDNIIDVAFKILNSQSINYVNIMLSRIETFHISNTPIKIFSDMERDVLSNFTDSHAEKYLELIRLLNNKFIDFKTGIYNELDILVKKNEKNEINIWAGGGRQTRKPPRKEPITKTPKMKDPKQKEPTKTPKAKKPAKTLNAKEPTKTPKAKEPTKTPKQKEPTKTPKQKEPTKTPKAKEPTKTPKAKEPTKTPKAKEPTKTPKQKEPTKTPKAKEPTKTPKPNEPTKIPKQKEPTKTPKPNEPTKIPKQKEPTKTPKQKEPTKTPKAKEPTKTPKAKEPTKTPKAKEPTKTPKAKEPKPTKTPKAKEPKPTKTPKAKEPKPTKTPKAKEPKPTKTPKAKEPKPNKPNKPTKK
jgi:hypothetical protein